MASHEKSGSKKKLCNCPHTCGPVGGRPLPEGTWYGHAARTRANAASQSASQFGGASSEVAQILAAQATDRARLGELRRSTQKRPRSGSNAAGLSPATQTASSHRHRRQRVTENSQSNFENVESHDNPWEVPSNTAAAAGEPQADTMGAASRSDNEGDGLPFYNEPEILHENSAHAAGSSGENHDTERPRPQDDARAQEHGPNLNGSPPGPADFGHDDRRPFEAGEAEEEAEVEVTLEEMKWSKSFIDSIRVAKLDEENLPQDVLENLRNPPTYPAEDDIDDVFRLCLKMYLSTTTSASNKSYHENVAAVEEFTGRKLLSLDQVTRKIRSITGVAPMVEHMCINSCCAFVAHWKDLNECPFCSASRWDQKELAETGKKVPVQTFETFPLGPQLQALLRSPESAEALRYRSTRTAAVFDELKKKQEEQPGVAPCIEVFDDIIHGADYLAAVNDGRIGDRDFVLMLSMDGAQLYQHKASDCWIYIWVVLDHAPDVRYKKRYVLPGGVIPGPKKPTNIDSFLFPGLHHVSALQQEGLRVWDGSLKQEHISRPYVHIKAADGPAMATMNGLTGHSGRCGCRMFCGVAGRLQHGANKYFPAGLAPHPPPGASVPREEDRNIREVKRLDPRAYKEKLAYVIASPNPTQYKQRRLETGISKPSIFAGLQPTLVSPIPSGFVLDLMHLIGLNLAELLIPLWRGTLYTRGDDDHSKWDWAVLKGEVWKTHGAAVAACTPHLPGSFDRPPRNPAEKINSGYKAWEYMLYLYVLGPGVFRAVLPEKYWRHHCRLVSAVRILLQRTITRKELGEAHHAILTYIEEYEELYYQRSPDRLHFVRQSIHTLSHIGPEVIRVGPPCLYTQWTMERMIGDLGREIRLHSSPFKNLSKRAGLRAQVNALKAMMPDLEREPSPPRASKDIGDGFHLLATHDKVCRVLPPAETEALRKFVVDCGSGDEIGPQWRAKVSRWGRLALPIGQVGRSCFKEGGQRARKVRIARMVKIRPKFEGGPHRYAEIKYYFQYEIGDTVHSLAMASVFSDPDPEQLRRSYQTLAVVDDRGDEGLEVFDVKDILTVVAMIPYRYALTKEESMDPLKNIAAQRKYFVCEKIGMDVAFYGGNVEDIDTPDGDDDDDSED